MIRTLRPRPLGAEPDLEAIRDSVVWLGRLSDSLIKVGPFSLGVDGVLAWIPGFGEAYSLAAAGFLLIQGVRARVPAGVLLICMLMMIFRTGISAVPLAGSAAADLFTAHRWSARLIVRAIERRLAGRGPLDLADSLRDHAPVSGL
jgi:hypothetical protein